MAIRRDHVHAVRQNGEEMYEQYDISFEDVEIQITKSSSGQHRCSTRAAGILTL